jgi:dephospho-CoA kinase
MKILGLTGSIATGKSTTAAMFARLGIPVWNADDSVHALYNAEAFEPLSQSFKGALVDGQIDRGALRALIKAEPERLSELESILHPLLAQKRMEWLGNQAQNRTRYVLLDIPLLFENHIHKSIDVLVVARCEEALQRSRALSREGMTPALYEELLKRQWPLFEKTRRAHAIIDTDHGLEAAQKQVEDLLRALA